MTYDQLLPMYRQITGLPGQDDAFNQWVQGVINTSGSQQGIDGIPNNFFDTPQGQQYVSGTTTITPVQAVTQAPTADGGFGQLVAPTTEAPPFEQAPAPGVAGGNYNQVQNATQAGQFGTIGQNYQQQTGTTGQTQTGTNQTTGTQTTGQQQQQSTTQGQQQQQATTTAEQQAQEIARQEQQRQESTSQQQQAQTGTSAERQAQESRTTGSTTQTTQGKDVTQAIDTLGFGKLLQDAAGTAGASDAERNAWLQDTMKTGGSGFNSQVDQAVRSSLSGPGMVGTGNGAQGRVAGAAVDAVARNNLNQRLAASEQLAGPTGMTTLSTAANPYIGKATTFDSTGTTFQDLLTKGVTDITGTQSSTGTTQGSQSSTGTTAGTESRTGTTQGTQLSQGASTGFSNMTGNTNTQSLTDQLQKTAGSTTGFQDLVTKGAESQAGTTLGQSSQSGAGQIPQGQPVKTGGCVLCTAGIELGLWNERRVLRKVIEHKLTKDWKNFRNAARGYFALFTPVARWLLTHPKTARVLAPVARMVVYEELRVSGRRLPLKPLAWAVHWGGHTLCAAVGSTLPVRGYVTDPVIIDIARRNDVLFAIKEGN